MPRNISDNRADINTGLTSEQTSFLKSKGYKISKFLGKGAFGSVFEAIYWKTPIAIKIQKIESTQQLIRELLIIRQLLHPHIVEFFDIHLMDDRLLIVMELAPGGDLHDLILYKKQFKENEAARFYTQIADGLNYCHQRGIAHKDIKPENIFLDQYRTVCKIGDFGLAIYTYDPHLGKALFRRSMAGTMPFIGPEAFFTCFNEAGFVDDCKLDVWAVGVVYYMMLHGIKYPFDFNINRLRRRDRNYLDQIMHYMKNFDRTVSYRFDVSREGKRFQAMHWIFEPKDRPTFDVLLRDEYLEIAHSFVPELIEGTLNTPQEK